MTVVVPHIYKTYIQVKQNGLNCMKTTIGKIGRKGKYNNAEEM